MGFSKFAGLVGLAFAATVSAVPDVTVTPLATDCSPYPPPSGFLVSADSTGTAIDGNGDTSSYSLGPTAIRWGYINFPVNNQIAKTVMKCTNNALQAWVPTGVSGTTWQPLVAATSIPYDAQFGYMFPGTNSPIQPYSHSIDGVVQPGVFLGAEGVTTWAYLFQNDTQWGEYYSLRLLGPDSADPSTGEPLFPGEFTGFIKVQGT